MTGESILVVEDNGIIALQIGELLEKNGYRVSGTTAYGEEAVELAKKNLPDLICMDIELMGKIDGIETARRIHEHADIPLIFLTAYSDSRRLARATETAPYNYIVKPFDERELLVAVEMALHRHAVDQQTQGDHAALPGDRGQCGGGDPAGFLRYEGYSRSQPGIDPAARVYRGGTHRHERC